MACGIGCSEHNTIIKFPDGSQPSAIGSHSEQHANPQLHTVTYPSQPQLQSAEHFLFDRPVQRTKWSSLILPVVEAPSCEYDRAIRTTADSMDC